MNIPEIFDIDLFQILADAYTNDFERENKKNIIGWSELPYGMRKIALKKIHGIKTESNMKTLMGQIIHETFQQPEALSLLITSILHETDIVPRQLEVVPEYKLKYEIESDKFLTIEDVVLEGHIDTNTSIFPWELKTTWTYDKYWSKEMVPYHQFQLNGYLGSIQKKWGVLSCINMRAFLNTFHSFKESSEKWSYTLPVHFSQKQFDLSIKKAELIFLEIDNNTANLECPVFDWECKYCDVREQCGKTPIRCSFVDNKNQRCTNKMYEWVDCLTEEFLEKPICQNCYENKTRLRKPYNDIKYNGKFYPYEVRYE